MESEAVMISVEEYLEKVLALVNPTKVTQTTIGEGLGRVLAEDLTARLPVPPFSNSAMDGFAVRSADLGESVTHLRVVGDIPAGATATPVLAEGQAARIMTGAPLPAGADAVVQVEKTNQQPGDVPLPEFVEVEQVSSGANVRYEGEDIQLGQVAVERGQVWTPAVAAAAASVGYGVVRLRERPRVAVLATGSELVHAGEKIEFGQIPDSNSVLIAGLVQEFGGEVVITESVADEPCQFRGALERAGAVGADLIVTSGAVSTGAFEVVRQVLDGQIEFVKVAMQPGKPQACGTVNLDGRDVAVLGLPGNPVSVFVSSWVYLRPLLAAFQERQAKWPESTAVTEDGWKSPIGRLQFIPLHVENGKARQIHSLGSGSHLVASFHKANALGVIPADVERVDPGDTIVIRPLKGL
ncbi:gephyrin-like molybdotransferase Glp [Actinomycetaceae bacterium MB13-C1-2]|nr:gephyrin-like molybdotransferase Glp [Actinomycetaceae bacterium MB13-C1-2]